MLDSFGNNRYSRRHCDSNKHPLHMTITLSSKLFHSAGYLFVKMPVKCHLVPNSALLKTDILIATCYCWLRNGIESSDEMAPSVCPRQTTGDIICFSDC